MPSIWRWKKKIDDRGRVQLPSGIFKALHLQGGDLLDITIDDRKVILMRPHKPNFDIESYLADLIQMLRTDERKYAKDETIRRSLMYIQELLEKNLEERADD